MTLVLATTPDIDGMTGYPPIVKTITLTFDAEGLTLTSRDAMRTVVTTTHVPAARFAVYTLSSSTVERTVLAIHFINALTKRMAGDTVTLSVSTSDPTHLLMTFANPATEQTVQCSLATMSR
jgi:hypothetical protein